MAQDKQQEQEVPTYRYTDWGLNQLGSYLADLNKKRKADADAASARAEAEAKVAKAEQALTSAVEDETRQKAVHQESSNAHEAWKKTLPPIWSAECEAEAQAAEAEYAEAEKQLTCLLREFKRGDELHWESRACDRIMIFGTQSDKELLDTFGNRSYAALEACKPIRNRRKSLQQDRQGLIAQHYEPTRQLLSLLNQATSSISQAEATLRAETQALDKLRTRPEHPAPSLDDGFASLDELTLQALFETYKSTPMPKPMWPKRRPCDEAAIIRGEIKYPYGLIEGTCHGIAYDGTMYTSCTILDGAAYLYIWWSDLIDPLMNAREHFDPNYVSAILPPSHNPLLAETVPSLRLHELTPYAHNRNLSEETQQRYIDALQSRTARLRGWTIIGPPGNGKSAFVCSWIADEITHRLARSQRKFGFNVNHELNVHRIKIHKWIAENIAWETRDYSDRDSGIHPPALSVERIEQLGRETFLPPCLVIEEIDKFRADATKSGMTNLQMLNALIDAVYEQRGTIIITSNETHDQLCRRLGESTFRRIFGTNDNPDHYAQWDFFDPA